MIHMSVVVVFHIYILCPLVEIDFLFVELIVQGDRSRKREREREKEKVKVCESKIKISHEIHVAFNICSVYLYVCI